MRKSICALLLLFSVSASAQKVTIKGRAVDSTNGRNAIEVVINDTLSRIMKNPKEGRSRYLRMYDDARFVVRTDSMGTFAIRANLGDTLYFKSYRHSPQIRSVRELHQMENVLITLIPE